MKNIYLIGMMGSGKSVVSEILANRLSLESVDMDYIIESDENMAINEIFAIKGERYFRAVESRLLKDVAQGEKKIVSTGGGVVLDDNNIMLMKETGIVVYLKASTDVLMMRLSNKTDRPLLNGEELGDKLREIFMLRSSLYERGNFTIDTTDCSPDEVADKIVELLPSEYVVC